MVSNFMLLAGAVIMPIVFVRAGEKRNAIASAFFVLLLLCRENSSDFPVILDILCLFNGLYAYRFLKAFHRINPIDGFD